LPPQPCEQIDRAALSPNGLRVRHGEDSNLHKEDDMKYALLVYVDPAATDGFSDADSQRLSDEYYAIRDVPGVFDGAHLAPVLSATTVRVQDGQTLTTDGPFADTKEVFGGYYLLDADNLDAAIEIASRVPSARMGGSVEIRPVVEERP
jgi:hypothetical protein